MFATRRFSTKNEKLGFGQERTIAVSVGKDGGERILRTVGGPACIAKNRYNLPYEIDLSWDAFYSALNSNPNTETQE